MGGTELTLLTWSHEWSVGIRAIDDQHGILMDAINELSLSLVHGGSRDQLGVLIERIVEFTRMHFSSEEQLMELTGYPGLAEHRAAHVDLLKRIRTGVHLLQHDQEVDMRSLLSGLRDGYREHISTMDRLYSPWLMKRGLV
jgi:hemerythrin-like metal-binding protein